MMDDESSLKESGGMGKAESARGGEASRREDARPPVASARDITFRYGDLPGTEPILDRVSLDLFPDDFIGLIGPNGGGKTTLLRIFLGLLKPRTGEVRVLGRPPHEVSPRIGYVPQHAKIDAGVPATVLDVVLTGRLGQARWGFHYGRRHVKAAEVAMEQAGVAEFRDRAIGELSGGQRQRVLIARALAGEARMLFLDEPMSGVDTHMEQGILELLHELNRKLPILLVSHDLGFISTHVRRVACLNRRLVVHRPEELSGDIIEEMYHVHGPVHRLHHAEQCPFAEDNAPDAESRPADAGSHPADVGLRHADDDDGKEAP